jgi:cytidylate kinase
VIVGRCADYALQDYQNCLNIFVMGDEKHKVQRILERYDDVKTEQKALDMMNKKDKQRQSYYNYYTSKKWGRADNYDLAINSSVLGIDGTVKLITQFVEDFENR